MLYVFLETVFNSRLQRHYIRFCGYRNYAATFRLIGKIGSGKWTRLRRVRIRAESERDKFGASKTA